MSARAEPFTVPCTFHGEGPFWDVVNDRLLLVDMLAGTVVAVDADGGTRRHKLSKVAAAVRGRRSGGYVLATENQFVLLGPDLSEERPLPAVFTATARPTRGCARPLGFTRSAKYRSSIRRPPA